MKRVDLRDESGLTLIELMVALTAGLIVMSAITLAMLVTIRETGRITSHVESNQQSRLTMTRVLAQLHSSCIAPQVAPVQAESTGTVVRYYHQVGSQVVPQPNLSELKLENSTLWLLEYPYRSGTAPSNWTFGTSEPVLNEELMTGIAPITESGAIFQYYGYTNGAISSLPFATPLSGAGAAKTVQMNITFKTVPKPPIQEDESAETEIQDSVLFRLSAPAYGTTTDNLPCQ